MAQRSPFRCFRTSPENIPLAMMLRVRFPLSHRNAEDLFHERGIEVSHETVRVWWQRFGPMFAAEIWRKGGQGLRSSRWRWHLDEVVLKVNGLQHYLRRAVGHDGEALEAFVSKIRDKAAALKLLKQLMKRHGRAEEFVTDGLKSDRAALREIGAEDRQVIGRWANNWAENSHQPFRRRKKAMLRFRRMHSLQEFAAVHGSINHNYNADRSLSPSHLQAGSRRCSRRVAGALRWLKPVAPRHPRGLRVHPTAPPRQSFVFDGTGGRQKHDFVWANRRSVLLLRRRCFSSGEQDS